LRRKMKIPEVRIVRTKEVVMGKEVETKHIHGNMQCHGKIVVKEGIIDLSPIPTIKVKRLHEDAFLPSQNEDTDAGYDIVAIDAGRVEFMEVENDTSGHLLIQYIEYRTGLSIEPPPGYHVEIFPRSSISKYDLALANSIGLVDEGYRGELLVRFKYIQPRHPNKIVRNVDIKKYRKGDKIAQLVIRKTQRANFLFADELSISARGGGGFGSSGV